MKSVFVAAAAGLVATSMAQDLSGVPTCALTCLTGALPESCGLDIACACSDDSFVSGSATCVQGSCSADDQQAALAAAAAICSEAGVTIPTDFPSESSAAPSTTAEPSSTAAPSESPSESSAPVSTAPVETIPSVVSTSTVVSSTATAGNGTNTSYVTSATPAPTQPGESSGNRLAVSLSAVVLGTMAIFAL